MRKDYPAIHFADRIPADLPPVPGERDDLQRLVGHLIDNAAKFSPAGSAVTLSAVARQDEVLLQVQDQGIGIEKSRLSEIFDPFHQLDDRPERGYRGMGLGLALVRRLVEALGGRIEVESDPGRGSTFSVALPRGGPPAPA